MRPLRRRTVAKGGDDGVDVDLTTTLGPLTLANPIVAASGTYGHGAEVARLADPGALGAITAKSLLPEPWAGKPAPRVHVTAAGMVNAVGLQGPGIEAWLADDLPTLRALGARVIVSLWGRTVEDYAAGAALVRAARDDLIALEVNVSCPNLHHRSEMFAHDAAATGDAVRAVVDAATGLPVFAKLSPNVTDITEIARSAVDAGATGLTLVNTVMGLVIDPDARRPVLGGGGGGISGPAIKPVALRAVFDVARALPGVPIIGTGGVSSGVDAVEMMLAGACAVGVGTASFLDPRAPVRIVEELRAWCATRGVAHVSELVGALEDMT